MSKETEGKGMVGFSLDGSPTPSRKEAAPETPAAEENVSEEVSDEVQSEGEQEADADSDQSQEGQDGEVAEEAAEEATGESTDEAPEETASAETEEGKAEVEPVAPARPQELDPETKQVVQWGQYSHELISSDPDLQKAFALAQKRAGHRLSPQAEALIAGPAVVAQAPVDDDAKAEAEFKALWDAGREKDANRHLALHYSKKAAKEAVDPIRKDIEAEKASRAQREQRAEAERVNTTIREEGKKIDKLFPGILVLDSKEPTGFYWKDKEVRDAVAKNCHGLNYGQPLDKVVKFTLFEMGRLKDGKVAPKPAAKVSAKPAVSTTKPRPRKEAAKGEVTFSLG